MKQAFPQLILFCLLLFLNTATAVIYNLTNEVPLMIPIRLGTSLIHGIGTTLLITLLSACCHERSKILHLLALQPRQFHCRRQQLNRKYCFDTRNMCGHTLEKPSPPMKEIPFWIWTSRIFQENRPLVEEAISTHTNKCFNTTNFIHTINALMRHSNKGLSGKRKFTLYPCQKSLKKADNIPSHLKNDKLSFPSQLQAG